MNALSSLLRIGLAVSIIALFSTFTAHAASIPIKAEVVAIKGRSMVFSADNKKSPILIKVGTMLKVGDRIRTGRTGEVEILYSTGDLARMSPNTSMTIKALHKTSSGHTTSAFWVAFGEITTVVLRKLSSRSKFEYHTKSAIAGVAGSPPFGLKVGTDGSITVSFYTYESFGFTPSEKKTTFTVTVGGVIITLKAGEKVVISKSGVATKTTMTQKEMTDAAARVHFSVGEKGLTELIQRGASTDADDLQSEDDLAKGILYLFKKRHGATKLPIEIQQAVSPD